jgi:hypothetical protein
MNVLFQFQQKAQKLDESKILVQSTKADLKALKQRLIEKEKERRVYKTQCEEKDALIKQQTCEIFELNKILGESSGDLAQMKMDAKCANTVMEELGACKRKNKSLKDEVVRLRALRLQEGGGLALHSKDLLRQGSNEDNDDERKSGACLCFCE